MTETKYTLEQFEIEFENSSFEKKVDIVLDLTHSFITRRDTLKESDDEIKETIRRWKDEISDIKSQMDIEENDKCNKDIESGTLTLFKCIKDYPFGSFNVGQNYYVKIDDVASDLKAKWDLTQHSEKIVNIINTMRPITWIYSDSGIGTLKKRTLFISGSGDFSEFFEKV